VTDKDDLSPLDQDGPTRLTLVTCWPFDALRAGGPHRYVVTATMQGDASWPASDRKPRS
jgi:sortase A